jgi:hypothetical protein
VIDFSRLVLGPAMAVFAQPCIYNPFASQPGAAHFAARGVWTNRPVEIPTEQGGYISTNQPIFGIRVADFAAAPKQDDQLTTAGVLYDVVDTVFDGQGGADLWLRRAE